MRKSPTMKAVLACAAALALATPLSTQAAGTIIDDFNVNEGHFNQAPNYSGSSTGIDPSSTADRVTTDGPREGVGHQKLYLVYNGTATTFRTRHLSSLGSPAGNTAITTTAGTDGMIGYYLKTTNSGWVTSINLDGPGNSAAEMDAGVSKAVTNDGQWHLYEWDLDSTTDWGAVPGIGGGHGGALQDTTHTIDSIWLRWTEATLPTTVPPATIYFDFVARNTSGSVSNLLEDPCINTSPVIVNGPISTNSNQVLVGAVDGTATKITVYQDSGAGMVEIGSKTSDIAAGNNSVTVTGLVKTAIVAATQTVAGQEGCVPTTGVVVGGGASPRVRVAFSIKETTSTGPIGEPAGDISSTSMHHLGATNVLSGYAPGSGVVLYPSTDWQTITLGGKQGIGDPASVSGTLADPPSEGYGYVPDTPVTLRVYAFKDLPTTGVRVFSATPAESTTVTSNNWFYINWSWSSVAGAEGYRIVRATDGATYGSYVDVAGTSYNDENGGDWLGGNPDVVVTPSQGQTERSIQWYPTANINPDNIPGEWGILESIAFAIDDLTDTGPYELYIDNLKNGDTVFQDFEAATAGQTDYGFRAPSYSSTTSGGLLMPPNIGAVSSAAADTGTKSFRVQWQWKSTNPSSWLRFTTHALLASSMPGRNPMVDLNEPISIRFLLLPVGTVPVPPLDKVTITSITATAIEYTGGGGSEFVLLESGDATASLSGWTRTQTNNATPGTFTITPSGSPVFYSIKSE